jgi:hypothetical protein
VKPAPLTEADIENRINRARDMLERADRLIGRATKLLDDSDSVLRHYQQRPYRNPTIDDSTQSSSPNMRGCSAAFNFSLGARR